MCDRTGSSASRPAWLVEQIDSRTPELQKAAPKLATQSTGRTCDHRLVTKRTMLDFLLEMDGGICGLYIDGVAKIIKRSDATVNHMTRKGQARWVNGSDVRQQIHFINQLVEVVA